MLPEESATKSENKALSWKLLGISIFFVVLMLLLRGPWLNRDAIFVDESSTHKRVLLPLSETLHSEAEPINTLIGKSFLAISSWTGIRSSTLLRVPQFFFSLTLLIFVVCWAYSLAGTIAALAAGLFLVFSPQFAAHSVICRYYPLLSLSGLFLCFLMLYASNPKSPWWIWPLIPFAVLAGVMNHAIFLPVAVMIFAGAGVALLVSIRTREDIRHYGYKISGLCLAGLLFTVLWLVLYPNRLVSTLGSVFRMDGMHFSRPPWPRYQLNLPQYFSFVFADNGLLPFPGWVGGLLGGLLVGLGIAWLCWKNRNLCLLFSAVLLFPAPFFFLETSHSWTARYFMAQLPIYVILSGLGIAFLCSLVLRSQKIQFTACLILMMGFIFYRVQAEKYNVVEGVRDPLADFAARTHSTIQADSHFILCTPDHLGRFRPASLSVYLNNQSPPPDSNANKRYTVKYTREEQLIPYLLNTKLTRLWIVVPAGPEEGDKFPEKISDAQQTLGFLGASLNMEYAGYQLWQYENTKDTQNIVMAESDFPSDKPGIKCEGGATVILPEGENEHGRVVEITVPNNAPLEPADGRPCPTIWFDTTVPQDLRDAIAKSSIPPRIVVSCEIKHQALQEGANPKRTMNFILRQGKTWASHIMLIKRQSGKDVSPDEPWTDWENIGTTFVIGDEIKTPINHLILGIGNRGGTGNAWIDNIKMQVIFSIGAKAASHESAINE